MPGAELQLAAHGEQNEILTGNPQMTYFVAVYKRYTNFAIENIEELFIGEPVLGGKSYAILGKYGDLIHKIYLDVELPSLNPNNDPNFYISWVNAIGHAIIKKVEIEIGGNKIAEEYGVWMEIWDELTLDNDKRFGYNDMIGKHDYFNVTMNQGPLHLRIPLQFWFCRHIGSSIPSIALYNNEIRLIVTFSEFKDLYVSSTGNLDPIIPNNSSKQLLQQKQFNIQKASLFVDYIYLDEDERRWFAQNEHTYLIDQVQRNIVSLDLTSIENVISLDFNHMVREIIWVVQDCINFKKVPGGGNDWFNFSDTLSYLGIPPDDPMVEAKIWFEGRERFYPARKAKYFREVEPYKYHTNIPNNFIYVYSFALFPEKHQPSGACNFSMLDNATLNITLKDTLVEPQVLVFATNYNILKIDQGMAGLQFLD